MARPTIVVVLVFLLMAGGTAAYFQSNPPPSTDTTVYVLEVKDTDVQRLDVATSAGSAAFERAEPFGWKFASSGEPADLSRVGSVVTRLAKLRSSAKVTDNVGELGPYSLSPPVDQATLSMKDGTSYRVLVGGKTVNDAAYYAIVDGRKDLHTINTLLVGDIEKLVSDPPAPTPTPDPNASPTEAIPTTTPTRVPTATISPDATPRPTILIPVPASGG